MFLKSSLTVLPKTFCPFENVVFIVNIYYFGQVWEWPEKCKLYPCYESAKLWELMRLFMVKKNLCEGYRNRVSSVKGRRPLKIFPSLRCHGLKWPVFKDIRRKGWIIWQKRLYVWSTEPSRECTCKKSRANNIGKNFPDHPSKKQ